MALADIDRVIAAGVRFRYVLADAGYGISAAFRQGLTARELAWAVGIPRHPDVPCRRADDLAGCWARRGRPRISWRTGTKGKLKARFAAIRVRIADGPPQRIRDKRQQHLPGKEAWLIGEQGCRERRNSLSRQPAGEDGPAPWHRTPKSAAC